MLQNRITPLNNEPFRGGPVVYVMARDQRVQDNAALVAAQQLARRQHVPLYVLFVLHAVEGRCYEQYAFMLEGLEKVAQDLATLQIPFILRHALVAADEIITVATELSAGAIFFDFNPLLGPRRTAQKVAGGWHGQVAVVDAHNIIPAWHASDKQEFAAHTFRRKVHQQLAQYLIALPTVEVQDVKSVAIPSLPWSAAKKIIDRLPRNGTQIAALSGEDAAMAHLSQFITEVLPVYARKRNDISCDAQSGLSPYLHFGQLASLRVALSVLHEIPEPPLLLCAARLAVPMADVSVQDGADALLEELIVRKELSDNFCLFTQSYRRINGGPAWGQKTLKEHHDDPRDFVYSRRDWEDARTHDAAWNAAQRQLRRTGKLHGYMRMYWAKKMLEWSETVELALSDCIYLNDKYSVDGHDPNGYVGILWSMVGLHDRPWRERAVFGQIRYMNEAGLRRKFDLDTYCRQWQD